MDCLFCCCLVYDTRGFLFLFDLLRSLSHFPAISIHPMALTMPDFLVSLVRYPPPVLVLSKFSWRISCTAIPTKQSSPKPQQVAERRQQRHNAMKQFLLKECCLSSAEITALVSKDPGLFRRRSTDRAQQAIQLLIDSGFTINQVRKTIIRNPSVLSRSVDRHLKPKIEYLKTLGIAEEDVSYIVSHHPRILTGRLDKTLAPKILSLIKFFGSKANLFKALRKAPGLVSYHIEVVNNKLRILESTGLLDHEIEKVLEKDPRFLCSSAGKIEKNMEFLTSTLGLEPNVVVKYPQFLNFSKEGRMRPRYEVFKYLNALRSSNERTISLVTMLSISEEDFTQRFLSGNPAVTMLYEKYKAKTANVEIT